jgi:hypothetical protein
MQTYSDMPMESIMVCTDFIMLEVKEPIIIFGHVGSSAT